MSNISAAIKLEQLSLDRIGTPEAATEVRKVYEATRNIINTLILAKTGSMLGEFEGVYLVEVPEDAAEVLKEVKYRVNRELKLSMTIGVGEDIESAKKALEYAIKNDANKIRVYTIDMEPQSQLKEHMQADNPIAKSEGDFTPISQEDKVKIAQTLDSIRQNQDYFEGIRQNSPEVYSGVVGIIQSLTKILGDDKIKHREQSIGLIDKMDQYFKDKVQGENQEQVDAVEQELMAAMEEFQSTQEATRRARERRYIAKHSMRMEKAEAHVAEHGGNPQFFAHLSRSLGR